MRLQSCLLFPRVALVLSALLLSVSPAHAQKKPGEQTTAEQKTADQKTIEQKKSGEQRRVAEPLSDEQVLAFVEKHHPELQQLLVRLKRDSAKDFEKALREIRVVAERVARVGGKKTPRAAYEIDRWKIDSRIRLLSARMISLMGEPAEGIENPNLEAARQQLRKLAEERVQIERDRLESDKRLLLERLAKLQEQSSRIDEDVDAAIERQYNALTRNIDVAARKRGIGAKRPKTKVESQSKPVSSKKSGNRKPSKTVDE